MISRRDTDLASCIMTVLTSDYLLSAVLCYSDILLGGFARSYTYSQCLFRTVAVHHCVMDLSFTNTWE